MSAMMHTKRYARMNHRSAGEIIVRILCEAEGWSLVRRERAAPFPVQTKELTEVVKCWSCQSVVPRSKTIAALGVLAICDDCDRQIERRDVRAIAKEVREGIKSMQEQQP